MKKITTTIFLIIVCFSAFSQVTNPYYTIHIQLDTAVQWAAESDKVINLTSNLPTNSLKNGILIKSEKEMLLLMQ